jgi:hypothetical protein
MSADVVDLASRLDIETVFVGPDGPDDQMLAPLSRWRLKDGSALTDAQKDMLLHAPIEQVAEGLELAASLLRIEAEQYDKIAAAHLAVVELLGPYGMDDGLNTGEALERCPEEVRTEVLAIIEEAVELELRCSL